MVKVLKRFNPLPPDKSAAVFFEDEDVVSEIGEKNRRSSNAMFAPSTFNRRMMRRASTAVSGYLEDVEDYFDDSDDECTQNKMSLLQRTLLRPNYSLKNQLFLSFGTVSAVALIAVMITTITGAIRAGDRIKEETRTQFTTSTKSDLAISTRYASESLTKILVGGDSSHLIEEVIRDRFVGYPYHEGYADDSLVPFTDVSSGRNVYPLSSPPLPLEWEFEPNVNAGNYPEHVQDRWSWYGTDPKIGTGSAVYHMQGQCDPNETNLFSDRFYPNCTEANNDQKTGGLIQPTSTNELIAQKASDLNFILKPLYESQQNAKSFGVYFANSGAGSAVWFPARRADNLKWYTSKGCQWMSAPNPRNLSRPIASQDDINRCHPVGSRVSGREYNALERSWCREQALDPDNVKYVGPYRDVFDGSWVLATGKAVYDRVTNEFIACTLVDIRVETITDILRDIRVSNVPSETALVHWEDGGTVVAGTGWKSSSATKVAVITDEGLGMGIDRSTFNAIMSLIDFNSPWDPLEATRAYETTFKGAGKIISCYPIPDIPDSYDPGYHPVFVLITSSDEEQAMMVVETTEKNLDDNITNLIKFTLLVGFIGLASILLIIFTVSSQLTRPLQWMNEVGDQIVDKFGNDLDKGVDITRAPKDTRCIPKTEITDVVKEFQRMLSNFSGRGTAKVLKKELTEVKNPFCLISEFKMLYMKRQESFERYTYGDVYPASNVDSDDSVDKLPQRCHYGRNLLDNDTTSTALSYVTDVTANPWYHMPRSPLFWWISGSIMTPLLITIVVISAVVTFRVSTELPDLVTDVEDVYMEMKADSLALVAKLRAMYSAQVMFPALRDLHILARVGNWLLLGAIERAKNSFPEMTTGTEQCKTSSIVMNCSYLRTSVPCSCDWPNQFGIPCQNFKIDARYLQKQNFALQSQDFWPNGDRNSTSFPVASYSPQTTSWWTNVSNVPGSHKGESSSGYETSYDRLRMIAALSVAQMPIHNYQKRMQGSGFMQSGLGFEADGLISAFGGCINSSPRFSFWESSKVNGGSTMRPDICPLGKHGFDPRCTHWYAAGKRIARQGERPLFVSRPYTYAGSPHAFQSATLPLNDNSTLIGLVFIDFVPNEIFRILLNKTALANDGFPVLITAQPDVFGADTVIGPGHSIMKRSAIADLVLLHDGKNSGDQMKQKKNRQRFDDIVKMMQRGETRSVEFLRLDKDGEEENVNFAFAPVFGASYQPVDSSDFSRGVVQDQSLVFALAMAETHPSLLEVFEDIKRTLRVPVNTSLGMISFVAVMAVVMVLIISNRVSISTAVPMAQLLLVVKFINRSNVKEDMPKVLGGSKEVSRVNSTFKRLYTVVRFSSAAYFSGDLEKAYGVLVDALALFQKINNEKAIGVANNNLGNTILTMYRTMRTMGLDEICGMSGKEIVRKGQVYFDRAINAGEEAIERINKETGFSLEYLVFMQQLSNRYFNRAMFLLTSSMHHECPMEAERLGLGDLIIARDMDVEFIDQSSQEGFNFDEDVRFHLLLSRIRGLLFLKSLSFTFDWDIEELFEGAFDLLKASVKSPANNKYLELGIVGKMQQLDATLIEYFLHEKNDIVGAATVGIRMLVEDEYVLVDTALVAINSLMNYLSETSSKSMDSAATNDRLNAYKESLISFELTKFKEEAPRYSIIESRRGDVTMETF